jgi:hypothetical protein
MGTQQTFMMILAAVIVSAAVAGTLGYISQRNIDENRKAIVSELQIMAAHENAFYKSPTSLGGGEGFWIPKINGVYRGELRGLWLNYNGFEGLLSGDTFSTPNGSYTMWTDSYTDDVLKIEGEGTQIGRDGENPVKARMSLTGATGDIQLVILN